MNERYGYTPEEFFGMIGDAVGGLDVSSTASLKSFYAALDKVMRLAVMQRVGDFDIAFAAGLFAKTDFLVKQLGIDRTVACNFNETRDRIRRIDNKDQGIGSLDKHWAYDMKAVTAFISAIYGNATVPDSLSRLFPLSPRKKAQNRLLATKMRVAVESVEGNVIKAMVEATGEEIVIRCSEMQKYILPLLSNGNQLNLIAPRKSETDKNILEAEHIILHPDLLVNITSVASCFEDYAHDARLFLFNKIKRPVNSSQIILGNFAGQLLDDAIHHRNLDYTTNILRFCRDNALSMASCVSELGCDFHEQARKQMQHIRNVVNNVMPKEVNGFNSHEVMLEPSFICEMLGIQGRMDMLQLDFKVLVEQKAGKGQYGYGNKPGEAPRQKTKHYVQLLLYMAVLHYNFNIPYSKIFSFLLYSKYDRSLLQLGSAPELLCEALKIRNQIAWAEYRIADENNPIYDTLSTNCLNVVESQRAFFDRYICVELDSLLEPIRMSGNPEKAYFHRFIAFVQREVILSRTGTKNRDDEGFAQTWLSTAREKAEAGNIYYGMELDSSSFELDHLGAVVAVSLRFPKTDAVESGAGISNFRTGDRIVLYSYPSNAQPNACKTMVFKATIADITLEGIRLGLYNPQTHRDVFEKNGNSLWAVEHDCGDASSSGLFCGLYSLLTAPVKRRQLILSQRVPEFRETITLNGDYGTFNTLVERAMQALDIFLVIGPPGTGKTSFAMLNILREELTHNGTSVLLLSYTNRAVDEMCGKLVEAGIDFLRIGNPLSCEQQFRSFMLDEKVMNCSKLDDIVSLINNSRVVCATVSTVNAHPELLSMRRFSLSIIDEASQILEPYIVGPLCATMPDGSESISRFVLIGDHKQLPAVVLQSHQESVINDFNLRNLDIVDCRHSLFQRLLRRYSANDHITYMLTRQGRMHRDIAFFPSNAFYSGLLQPVPLGHQERQLETSNITVDKDLSPYVDILTTKRVAFIDAPQPAISPSDKVNTIEADIISRLAVAAYKIHEGCFSAQTTLGIIVPYRNQIVTLRNAIDKYGIAELHDITIDTVERYQGSQRDIIIYGFTVSHRYQLDFLTANDFEENGAIIDPKLNVAMTRARENLVLVGNKSLLRLDPVFRQMIDSI